jgi:Cytochrome P460
MALAIVTATPGQVEAIPADRCRVGSDVRDTELAMKAYREGKLPFPDGTIIARLARSYVPSEENNRVFGRSQSFVAGPATNVQFMVKDSKKYAATGGWGGSLNSKTANPRTRRCSKPAFPATSPSKLATSSSLIMHREYGGDPMNKDESFDNLTYAKQVHLAERELASFIGAVKELFGPEQARLSANDWLDESELMDCPPRSSRDWRTVTVAASARLANRVTRARDRRTPASSTDPKVSPILSSNCFASALLV